MKYLLIHVILLFPLIVYAQQGNRYTVDSLIKLLPTYKDDTNKVKLFDKVSYLYSGINPDSGIIYADSALKLAITLGWDKGIAVAHADLGFNYKIKSEYDSALKHEVIALKTYQKLALKSSEAAMLCNIASIYHAQGNYTKALQHNLRALKIFELLDIESSQAAVLENIGSIFLEQKEYEKALYYYTQALETNTLVKDSLSRARNLGNIGIVYDKQGKYKEALNYHLQALSINKKFENDYSVQLNHANVGVVYHHMNKVADALKHHIIALGISERINSKASIAINSGNVGEMYLRLAKNANTEKKDVYLKNAVVYLERATEICKEINHPAPLSEFSQYLSEAYELSGNYPLALKEYKFFSKVKDSLYSIQTKVKLSELELKRMMDIKDRNLQIKENEIQIFQLQAKQEKNMRIIYIISLILILLVLAITIKEVFAYKKSNKILTVENSKQYQDIEKRNRALEEIAHTHSHEIRNHVATILGLSELFESKDGSDDTNKTILDGIKDSAVKLDDVLKDITKKIRNQ